mmetsp:Transcript_5873/g.6622  ORF Transcript_5873/g.6622 Transcript_5873/m.6622 type:complete len:215 (+) Transcript_5873:95-739(+)
MKIPIFLMTMLNVLRQVNGVKIIILGVKIAQDKDPLQTTAKTMTTNQELVSILTLTQKTIGTKHAKIHGGEIGKLDIMDGKTTVVPLMEAMDMISANVLKEMTHGGKNAPLVTSGLTPLLNLNGDKNVKDTLLTLLTQITVRAETVVPTGIGGMLITKITEMIAEVVGLMKMDTNVAHTVQDGLMKMTSINTNAMMKENSVRNIITKKMMKDMA